MRPVRLAAIVIAALAMALPAHAQDEPVRSGRILAGASWSRGAFGGQPEVAGSGTLGACQLAPDCLPWLQSMCAPALAGREPSVTSSIVDVADLADGRTPRQLGWQAVGGVGLHWGEAMVQFWRSDCTEITTRRWRSWQESCCRRAQTTVTLPVSAKWMTVVLTNDHLNVGWTLR